VAVLGKPLATTSCSSLLVARRQASSPSRYAPKILSKISYTALTLVVVSWRTCASSVGIMTALACSSEDSFIWSEALAARSMTGLVHVGCSASIVYTWANSSRWRSMATMVELVPRQTLSSPGLEAR
jgi:hypothetical protein